MGQHRSDVETYLDYGIDYRRKSMIITGEITRESTDMWCRILRALDRTRTSDELLIYMNSDGGDVYQALALYDTILSCTSEVRIHVVGECMSMAIWVLQAADRRTASPNSRFMTHIGSFSLGEQHHHTNLRWSDQFRRDEEILVDQLVSHLGITKHRVRKLLAHDTILLSEEAKELGIIDEVIQ